MVTGFQDVPLYAKLLLIVNMLSCILFIDTSLLCVRFLFFLPSVCISKVYVVHCETRSSLVWEDPFYMFCVH